MDTLDLVIECVPVRIDGQIFNFWPLNFKSLKMLTKEFEALRTIAKADERFDAICKILLQSANRKGQQTTLEALMDMLDPTLAGLIMEKINEASGFRKVEVAPGEEVPPTKPLNGAASMPQS